MNSRIDVLRITTATALLGAWLLAGARGHEHSNDGAFNSSMPAASAQPSWASSAHTSNDGPQSYFEYPMDTGLIYAHIACMVVAWIFVLPFGLALSIARSRIALPVHYIFMVINVLGLLTGTIYNSRSPDLYPNNAHHKLGWWITWIFTAQAIMGLVGLITGHSKAQSAEKEEQTPTSFTPISVDAMTKHQRIHSAQTDYDLRFFSGDSGQGTERSSSSLRGISVSPTEEHIDRQLGEISRPDEPMGETESEVLLEDRKRFPQRNLRTFGRYLMRKVPIIVSRRTRRVGELVYDIIDRLLLPLAFVTFSTGVVTYGGIFRGDSVFNGLAHFIKGGIFFWYGLLTLARWMGCFADFGWAWNVKPSRALVGARKASVPSAEFVESFVIFLYGSTNVFLEHLAAWGEAWTAQDLEHVSISVMFFGGGLCGMLIESRGLRDLLNAPIVKTASRPRISPWNRNDDLSSWNPPRTYKFSMNPLPGLIILLLGIMMGSHHQSSMVSTMVHKQWGMLLVGFAFARAVTYLIMYLSPPTSLLPSRPPSELVTSFCLISGGLIFMASNKDTVAAMEAHRLEAMFIFTVTVGLTAFLMSWTIFVVAVKGWATCRAVGGNW